jgi:hypothetical protein
VTTDDFEYQVESVTAQFAFIRRIATLDKADHAIKLRLYVDDECFVQVYTNIGKGLLSFTLIINRIRMYGRDCEGGAWHRHPYDAPKTHDFSAEGQRVVTLAQFLAEVQQILQAEDIL